MYRIAAIKTQVGWIAQAEFMASVSTQFTDIQVESSRYVSRYCWVAILKCYFWSKIERRRINSIHREERARKGWS